MSSVWPGREMMKGFGTTILRSLGTMSNQMKNVIEEDGARITI
jgi:hypothetical protein